MDVSELRKQILRALDDARKDASSRRTVVDEAARAYTEFHENIAVPLLRQAATVLKGEGQLFTVHAPAESVRLVTEKAPDTFIELALDTSGREPQVLGRVSLSRGRQGRVEERPLAGGKRIVDLTEDDVAEFLLRELPKLIVRS